MWRAGRKTVLRVKINKSRTFTRNKETLQEQELCDCPTLNRRSGLKTVGMVTGGSLFVATGLTYVFARSNSEFRDTCEKYIPGSKTFFNYTLGSAEKKFTNFYEKPLGIDKKAMELNKETSILATSESFDSPAKDSTQTFPIIAKPLKDSGSQNEVSVKQSKALAEDEQALDQLCLAEDAKNTSLITVSEEGECIKKLENSSRITTVELQNPVFGNQLAPVACLNKAEEAQSDELKDKAAHKNSDDVKQTSENDVVEEFDLETKLEYEASVAILDELLSCCSVTSSNAILLSNAAADATSLHASLLRTALDDLGADPEEKSLQWNDVSKALDVKEKKLEEANLFYEKADEELMKLKTILQQMNGENVLVKERVEEISLTCSSMMKDLEDAKSKVTVTLSSAQVLDEYKLSLEKAKNSISKDYNLPEGKVMEEWRRESSKLKNREDIEALRNMQIKVEELQHKLVDERNAAMQRFEKNVSLIREETETKMKENAEEEKKKVLEETKSFYEKELLDTKSSLEKEMEDRLKEQSKVHAEHLAQALTFLDKQVSEKYENALQKEIEGQWMTFQKKFEEQRSLHEEEASMLRDQYQVELNLALAQIQGIRKALEGRAIIESETRKAQELSLACDSLLVSIKNGNNGQPMPLAMQLDNVKQVYGEHPAITVLSAALPQEAQSRGVYPEDVIRKSFFEVANKCRKVSMVDENRNSLFIYFLSYLKSSLTKSDASLQPPEYLDENQLTIFDILSYATYCVEHGNIEQAVRFLNQLKGESRKVAQDWIREARLYLETKQSVDALSAVSTSIVIGAQLE